MVQARTIAIAVLNDILKPETSLDSKEAFIAELKKGKGDGHGLGNKIKTVLVDTSAATLIQQSESLNDTKAKICLALALFDLTEESQILSCLKKLNERFPQGGIRHLKKHMLNDPILHLLSDTIKTMEGTAKVHPKRNKRSHLQSDNNSSGAASTVNPVSVVDHQTVAKNLLEIIFQLKPKDYFSRHVLQQGRGCGLGKQAEWVTANSTASELIGYSALFENGDPEKNIRKNPTKTMIFLGLALLTPNITSDQIGYCITTLNRVCARVSERRYAFNDEFFNQLSTVAQTYPNSSSQKNNNSENQALGQQSESTSELTTVSAISTTTTSALSTDSVVPSRFSTFKNWVRKNQTPLTAALFIIGGALAFNPITGVAIAGMVLLCCAGLCAAYLIWREPVEQTMTKQTSSSTVTSSASSSHASVHRHGIAPKPSATEMYSTPPSTPRQSVVLAQTRTPVSTSQSAVLALRVSSRH